MSKDEIGEYKEIIEGFKNTNKTLKNTMLGLLGTFAIGIFVGYFTILKTMAENKNITNSRITTVEADQRNYKEAYLADKEINIELTKDIGKMILGLNEKVIKIEAELKAEKDLLRRTRGELNSASNPIIDTTRMLRDINIDSLLTDSFPIKLDFLESNYYFNIN